MLRNKIYKTSFIFGVCIAIVCIIIALIQYYILHKSPFGRYKVPSFGINIIFIFFSIWYFRLKNNGLLSFTYGFTVGFLTNLFGAILTGIFFFIFTQWFDSQSLTMWVNENLSFIEKIKEVHIKNFGQADFDKLLKQTNIVPTPFDVLIDEITKKQICVIAVTIVSMILRKHYVEVKVMNEELNVKINKK